MTNANAKEKSKTYNLYRSPSICPNTNAKYDDDKNESLHVAIGPNANVLSDRKSLHTHGCRRVAHATPGGKTTLVS